MSLCANNRQVYDVNWCKNALKIVCCIFLLHKTRGSRKSIYTYYSCLCTFMFYFFEIWILLYFLELYFLLLQKMLTKEVIFICGFFVIQRFWPRRTSWNPWETSRELFLNTIGWSTRSWKDKCFCKVSLLSKLGGAFCFWPLY